ncbi:hypothetical protein G7046_g10065 [Stylonectria norvegica]|nr:hypothetical protein G7046_g10065 [Stylonectria norvegica]
MADSISRGTLGRVLVIGGNGFLGHHIVDQLVASWTATVSSVDLRCTKNRNPAAAYYECDITDVAKLTSVLEDIKPDVVIHTASPLAIDAKNSNEIFRRVNVDGTQAVVEACQKTGVKALVYTSSASVVSDTKTDLLNADERWPLVRGAQQPEPPPKRLPSKPTAKNPTACSPARSAPRAFLARATCKRSPGS